MYNSAMFILMLLPIMAMMNLVLNQTHLLMTLLSLEGVTLSLVLFAPLLLISSEAPNTAMAVIILTFGACEASLGLSLMVAMSRHYGNDLLKSVTLSKC